MFVFSFKITFLFECAESLMVAFIGVLIENHTLLVTFPHALCLIRTRHRWHWYLETTSILWHAIDMRGCYPLHHH